MGERIKNSAILSFLLLLFCIHGASYAATIDGDVVASADNTKGVNLLSGEEMNVTGNIIVTGLNAIGAQVDGGVLNVSKDISVTGEKQVQAIYATNDALVQVDGNVYLTKTDAGGLTFGVQSFYGADVQIDGNIEATGISVLGALVHSADLHVGGNVIVSGDGSFGVRAPYAVDSVSNVTVDGVIALYGDYGAALLVEGSGASAQTGAIEVYGNNAYGVSAWLGGNATVGSITVSGDESVAIDVYAEANVTVDGDVNLIGKNIKNGIVAYGDTTDAKTAYIDVNGNVNLFNTTGSSVLSYGISATNNSVISAWSLYAEGAESDNTRLFGVHLSGAGSTVNISDPSARSSVVVKGTNAVAVASNLTAGNYFGTFNMANGDIDIFADGTQSSHFILWDGTTVNLENVNVGLKTDNRNLLWSRNFNTMNVSDGSYLRGDVLHSIEERERPVPPRPNNFVPAFAEALDILPRHPDDDGTLTINLTDSTLEGSINLSGDKGPLYSKYERGGIDAILRNSQWLITADSLTNGVLDVDSTSVVDYRLGALGTKATVNSLKGNGTFVMKTDISAETADRLIVEAKTEGDHLVVVANSGSAATTGKERTTLIETADKGGDFTLVGGGVDAGAWLYKLRNNDDGRGRYDATGGQYWELYADGASNPASSGVNTFIGTYFLTYAETDTLIKRLGDLRSDLQHSTHGAWFRGFGGKMESDSRSYVRGFDMDYWGVQMGYDNLLERETSWFKNGDTYVGGFVGMSKGDMDFDQLGNGTGDLEQHTMGMYWTYIHDTGYYFDAIAKYVWSKNEFNVHDSAGTMVQGGKINTGGVGLSLEMGRRLRFNDAGTRPKEDSGNWYLEPQVQLSWQHFSGGTFHADNGLRIGVDDFNSLIGRIGALVGYESAKTNVYVKAFYLKEFDGDMNVNANDVIIYETLDDDWWVYGIGVTHMLNPRNALYLDLETSRGGDFENKWRLNAGWRISF
ncbi:autotransporter outer membrane beta-barrel domain-containing protein [Synergistaceae bacterium OttesenSCG-928-D05]|nr:autotransporter outer membrane beta-barrel domain-containing protein [Synergistaceae bacterium OttesenSCG-928-D05]